MNTATISELIQKAMENEKPTGLLRTRLRRVGSMYGLRLNSVQLEGLFAWACEYIEHVPSLMSEGLAASKKVGLEAEMRVVIEAAESYWFDTEDLIPDALGLLGILDDAYCSLSLLDAISKHCQKKTGSPLLPQDLSSANDFIRKIIGEPQATKLDGYIRDSFKTEPISELMASLVKIKSKFGPLPVSQALSRWESRIDGAPS